MVIQSDFEYATYHTVDIDLITRLNVHFSYLVALQSINFIQSF